LPNTRWLWLAVLAPLLLIALQRYSSLDAQTAACRIASPVFLDELTRSHSPARRAVKSFLARVGGFGIGVPWLVLNGDRKTQLLGQDIIFLLDCSRSMLARMWPQPPAARQMRYCNFVQHQNHGRVGWLPLLDKLFSSVH